MKATKKLKRFEVLQKRNVIQARTLEIYATDEDEAVEMIRRQGEIVEEPWNVDESDWEIIDIEQG